MKIGLDEKPQLPRYHVVVDFGAGVPADVQGRALLAFEKHMRGLGVPAEVFKREMADDLKRRRDMTEADRKRL